MVEVNRKSWHYLLQARLFDGEPGNLCSYLWRVLFSLVLAAARSACIAGYAYLILVPPVVWAISGEVWVHKTAYGFVGTSLVLGWRTLTTTGVGLSIGFAVLAAFAAVILSYDRITWSLRRRQPGFSLVPRSVAAFWKRAEPLLVEGYFIGFRAVLTACLLYLVLAPPIIWAVQGHVWFHHVCFGYLGTTLALGTMTLCWIGGFIGLVLGMFVIALTHEILWDRARSGAGLLALIRARYLGWKARSCPLVRFEG